LFIVGLNVEAPVFKDVTARSWGALLYLGLVASVGGCILYFILLKRLSPVLLSFVFIIFPVFALLIGAWYEGTPISRDLMLYSEILLAGFAITKLTLKR
ncbi:EamA family transporter, partial [Pseudomonas sp. MWU12-2323]|uniref:EamA family transporter n=1 Tax=Pseudomonas sp. MWU12-2323 TaxID=2651296 RepID=UPI00128BD176